MQCVRTVDPEIPDMLIGTVANLWRYPVKSLAAEPLVTVMVEPGGFARDRGTALMVTNPGHPRMGKAYRGKEHRRLHTVETTAAAELLGAQAGIALVAQTGDHYFDAQPISLLFDTWLADVETLVGRHLDPLRYRPNIFARAAERFTVREAGMIGTTLGIGSTNLRVVATIGRCVTTTYDIATGESDPAILRAVATERANIVGVYCVVEQPGEMACDMDVRRLTPS